MAFRTDLILEARELHPDLAGVTERTRMLGTCRIRSVTIETEEAAETLDKPCGTYITLETDALTLGGTSVCRDAQAALSAALRSLLPQNVESSILVVGLGNRSVTPDALGPETARQVFVTQHLSDHLPEAVPENMRSVAVFQPGVLGITGIETASLVRAAVECVHPSAVLCIDALAARRSERIGASIQLNNSGIQPGAGIGNRREGLTEETLGVPVVAVGVPLVVYVSTLAADVLSVLAAEMRAGNGDALEPVISEIVRERFGPMIVTPKEIDALLHRASMLLSDAINHALQGKAYEDLRALMQ